MIAVTGWLLSNWRTVALGAAVAAVLGFAGLSLHWRSQAIQRGAELAQARKDLSACTARTYALQAQIKAQAVEEGKRYEKTEADHLAACRDAYIAGARRLPNDKAAVAAGRYLPKSGSGPAKR